MLTEPLHVTLILLAAAVLVVGVFRSLNLSSILGYLVVGAVLGPHALGWLPDTEHTRLLAELGVVFLLFTVGLEFSIPTLLASRHTVLGLGGLQVSTTALAAGMAAWLLGLSPAAAFVIGGAVAMSSTAVVIKQLGEQMELSTRHGRMAVGVLLFQDLATLPFLLLLPRLGAGSFDMGVLLALLKGVIVFVFLAGLGRWVVRPVFHWVATRRSPELFMLAALLTVLGSAALAHGAGLSPPLGAFLAGMVLGETEFRHQIEDDVRPFREVLLGLFFATIGMALNPAVLSDQLLAVIALAATILLGKLLLISLLVALFGEHPTEAIRTGIILCQAGEFGLLLVSMGLNHALLPVAQGQILLAALILSMAAAPLLIRYNENLVTGLQRLGYRSRKHQIEDRVAATSADLDGHVIIAGYGRMGQNLGELLDIAGRPYLALDLDPERIRAARAAGRPVIYGDATREALLKAAGAERAAALVITPDGETALRILRHARRLSPALAVLARTRDDERLDELLDADATEVLPESLESSLIVGAHLLRLLHVPESEIKAQIEKIRSNRYRSLRRFFHSRDRTRSEGAYQERLASVTLPDRARAVGRTLQELNLDDEAVEVTSVIRDGLHMPQPAGKDTPLRAGDTVVLSGVPQALEKARRRLCTEGS